MTRLYTVLQILLHCLFIPILIIACTGHDKVNNLSPEKQHAVLYADSIAASIPINSQADTAKILPANANMLFANIQLTTPAQLVGFAKTLIGTPYKYGSTDPNVGFDCSGFITFVFKHFSIPVPRSSVEFTDVGRPVTMQNAREGDLVLFTGTVDSIRIVGHMGIITENADTLKFIHSTSGKANGVTISNLSTHYQKRFVKIIRVFAD